MIVASANASGSLRRKQFFVAVCMTGTLIQKLQELPPQRLAKVEDFVEFLVVRESRSAAGTRLGESLSKLDALNLPPLTDEKINIEIQAARQTRTQQRT